MFIVALDYLFTCKHVIIKTPPKVLDIFFKNRKFRKLFTTNIQIKKQN